MVDMRLFIQKVIFNCLSNQQVYQIQQKQSIRLQMDQSNIQSQSIFEEITTQKIPVSPHIREIQNSRILNRKQIQKRLQNLKPAEYQRVIHNLSSQNKILQTEVKNLHEKVQQLMISKKLPNPHNKNPLLEEQVKKTKKQLALKYESMNYLKQEVRKLKQSEITQQMRNKINEQKNQIVGIDLEIQKLLKEKQSLSNQYAANAESLEEYIPKSQNRDERINSLKEENKIFRNKIQQFNEKSKTTLKNSQSALEKFYNLKQQEQKFIKALIETKTSKKKLTTSDIKSFNANEITALQKQVEDLKKQKKQAEKQLVNQKIIKDQKKARLQKEARESIEEHKQLLKKRMKVLNQLNLYEAKDRRQRQTIQNKQQQQKEVQRQQRGCQTDKIVPIDFRKQWVGASSGIVFDDSLILDYRSHVYIKSLIIYKNADYIGFVKFFYENIQKKRYQTKVPFDSSFLRKLQSKKYTAKGNAFLKSFKVSLTNDRVTKLQFIWSDGQISSEGWQNQGSTKFTADIDAQQRPISMFGTLCFQGKNMYALESLGCEINKIESDQ